MTGDGRPHLSARGGQMAVRRDASGASRDASGARSGRLGARRGGLSARRDALRARLGRLRARRGQSSTFRSRLCAHRGQASVELLGALPVLLLLGLFLFQALAGGYAAVLAGNAAEAGALSLAGGGEAEAAARQALPGWSRAGMEVAVDRGLVEVSLRPPSPLRALAERLEVSSSAAVRAPRG